MSGARTRRQTSEVRERSAADVILSLSCDGQLDDEAGALSERIIDADGPPRGFDEAAANREAEPRAFSYLFGGHERFEQALAHVRIDARSVVLDDDSDGAVAARDGERDLALGAGGVAR